MKYNNNVNIAKYAKIENNPNDIMLEWEEMRDIFAVIVKCSDSSALENAKIQYWQMIWPNQRVSKGAIVGAGGSGFKDMLSENKEFKISKTLEKDYRTIQPEDIETWIGNSRANSEINSIFCVSDSIGLAVAKTIEKMGKAGQIKIVCIGESMEVMKLVKQNVIQVAISRRPYRLGYSSVIVLHNMIKAGIRDTLMILPKSEMIELGVIMVTPTNIDDYKKQLLKWGIKADF